ncbi:MAG: RecQ family ATP-dependent DNA helicase [Enterococcus sp.]
MLEQQLAHFFGYQNFRKGQKEIIEALLANQDTLAILPTGTGKSLCYQLAGYLKEGLVIVVAPLISLMEDQVYSLQKINEKRTIALNSTLSSFDKEFVLKHLQRYKFLFVSPEMLQQVAVINALKQQPIALLVVDEAHCVSQWGIDFRPDYRRLNEIKAQLNHPVTLALTATATNLVQQEISNLLMNSQKMFTYKESVNRENIALFVEVTEDKVVALRSYLNRFQGSGIIYCATRKQVEFLYQELRQDYPLGYYHGGLQSSQRRNLQQQFVSGKLRILVATNAFGMGINKADIQFVIHYELADSLENYLQEIGRAGRNGEQAYAVLLYRSQDERIHHFFQQVMQEERKGLALLFENPTLTPSELQAKWQTQAQVTSQDQVINDLKNNERVKKEKLQKMLDYIFTKSCRREVILNYFAEAISHPPSACCDFHRTPLPEVHAQLATLKEQQQSWENILLKLFKDN